MDRPSTWTDPKTGSTYEVLYDEPQASRPTTWTDPKSGDTYEVLYDDSPSTPALKQEPKTKADTEFTRGVMNVEKGSLLPEDYRELPKAFAGVPDQIKADIINAASSNLDDKKAGQYIYNKYKGAFGSPETLSQWVKYKRNPWGTAPVSFSYKEDGPQITVEAKGKDFTGLDRTAVDLNDTLQGIKAGAMNIGEGLPTIAARLLDESGLTDSSLDTVNKALDLIHSGEEPIDPLSGQYGTGHFIGEMGAMIPLTEVAPFVKALPGSKAAEAFDTALQGSIGSVLATGGKDPVENASLGALSGAALHAGIGTIASPFSKIKFGENKNIIDTSNPKVTIQTEVKEPSAPRDASEGLPPVSESARRVNDRKMTATRQKVDEVTKGWTNSPNFNVIRNTRALTKEQRDAIKADGAKLSQVEAFIAEDGTVHIISDNIKHPDDTSGIVFHEALHKGLANEFRKSLDGLLADIYELNYNVRREADKYMKDNPNVYAGESQHIRATEEALASMGEKGLIDQGTWARIVAHVRNWAREHGLGSYMRYTDNDVKAILRRAHQNVISGSETGTVTGNRYMYTGTRGASEQAARGSTASYDKYDEAVSMAEEHIEPNDYAVSFNIGGGNKYSLRKDNRPNRGKHVDDFFNSVREEMPDRTMTEEEARTRLESMYGAPSKVMRKKMEVDPTLGPKAVQVTEDAVNKALTIGKKIISHDASPREQAEYAYQIARAADWAAKIEGYKSDLGRALRMLQLVSEGRMDLKDVNLGELGNPDYLYKLAVRLENGAADPKILGETLRSVYKPNALDYITSFRYAMMLSSPASHMKNLVGNLTMTAIDLMTEAGASVLGQFRRGWSTEDRVHMRQVAAMFYGQMRAVADGATWKDVAKSWKEGHPAHMVSKIEDSKVILPSFLSAPQRALASVDSFFRSIIENGYFYSSAMKTALAEGHKGGKLSDRIEELVHNPTKEMVAWADRQAAIIQLVDEPSAFVKMFNSGARNLRGKGTNKGDKAAAEIAHFVMQNAVPFLRVRDRLFFSAVRHSPLAAFDRVWREDVAAGGGRRDKAIAQWMMGSTLVGLLLTKAMSGEATGNQKFDIKNIAKNAKQDSEGFQPNSVSFNGKWYSLDGFDLISNINPITAKIGADYRDGKLSDEAFYKEVWDLTGSVAMGLRDASAFAAVGDFYTKTAGDESEASQYGKNTAMSFAPSILKYSNQFPSIGGDDTVRETGGSLEGRLKSAIPGLSQTLPVKYDLLGREVKKEGKTVSGLLQSRTIDKSPVVKELSRLSSAMGGSVIVGPVKKSDLDQYGEVTPEMKSDYQRVSGYNINIQLQELVKNKEWMSQSDEDKVKDIRSLSSDIRKATREALFEDEQ